MTAQRAARGPWRRALFPALTITAGISALFVYWFGVADRYVVFLYDHLGAGHYDPITTSRYWMAGLVAGGIVTCLYTPFQALLGWRARRPANPAPQGEPHVAPDPLRIWVLCAPPLAAVIPAVTMTVNAPTLSAGQALGCTIATLAALALALAPARWATERPIDLAWLAGDGLGLVPVLLLLRVLELPAQGLFTMPLAVAVAAGAVASSVAWLGLMTALRAWRRPHRAGVAAIILAGLTISYLLLPLAHYVLATPPGYRYITTSSNFFPNSPSLLAASLAVAALLAVVAARLPGQGH